MNTFTQTVADPEPFSPAEAFLELMRVLRLALPAPDKDTPAAWARRDRSAIIAVRALQPENAAEGRMAAQIVAADAWASDCLRLAEEKWREPSIADKCRAQAMGMMREAKSATRTLLRMQAVRRAIEADPAAAERAAWVEHGVGRMMEAGLAPDAEENLADGDFRAEAADGVPTSQSPDACACPTPGPSSRREGEARAASGGGIGTVSRPAINPPDVSCETEAGFRGPLQGTAAEDGSQAGDAAPGPL